MPLEHIQLSVKIIDYAKQVLKNRMNPNIYITPVSYTHLQELLSGAVQAGDTVMVGCRRDQIIVTKE